MTTKTGKLPTSSSYKSNLSPQDDPHVQDSSMTSSPKSEFLAGIKIIAPILLGVAPFAVIIGISTVDLGMSPLLAMGMSLIMLAGTAQLAMLQLIKEDTPIVVILLTAIVINLRFAMPDHRGL